MQRATVMLFAVFCYFAFFLSFVYFVGFVAGLPMLPTHVDKGIVTDTATAFIVDVLLIALFGLQHSVMARKGFKAALTRHVPPAMERSLYCLASAAALGIMFALWHPMPQTIWHVGDPTGRVLLWILFGLGFGVVFISTWLISHFELFGLAQAWSHFRGSPLVEQKFRTPLFYAAVRHPIYLGFLLALWSTPDMSAGHLLLALGLTGYIFIGIRYEERDLVGNFGAIYVEYRERVGMVIPRLRRG